MEQLRFADSLHKRRDLVVRHPDHKRLGLKPWLSAGGVKQHAELFGNEINPGTSYRVHRITPSENPVQTELAVLERDRRWNGSAYAVSRARRMDLLSCLITHASFHLTPNYAYPIFIALRSSSGRMLRLETMSSIHVVL